MALFDNFWLSKIKCKLKTFKTPPSVQEVHSVHLLIRNFNFSYYFLWNLVFFKSFCHFGYFSALSAIFWQLLQKLYIPRYTSQPNFVFSHFEHNLPQKWYKGPKFVKIGAKMAKNLPKPQIFQIVYFFGSQQHIYENSTVSD